MKTTLKAALGLLIATALSATLVSASASTATAENSADIAAKKAAPAAVTKTLLADMKATDARINAWLSTHTSKPAPPVSWFNANKAQRGQTRLVYRPNEIGWCLMGTAKGSTLKPTQAVWAANDIEGVRTMTRKAIASAYGSCELVVFEQNFTRDAKSVKKDIKKAAVAADAYFAANPTADSIYYGDLTDNGFKSTGDNLIYVVGDASGYCLAGFTNAMKMQYPNAIYYDSIIKGFHPGYAKPTSGPCQWGF